MDEWLLDTMFVKSIGNRYNSQFGTFIPALQTSDDLMCQMATVNLLQELTSQQGSTLMGDKNQNKVFVAHPTKKNRNKGGNTSGGDGAGCRYCGKPATLRLNVSKGSAKSQKKTWSRRRAGKTRYWLLMKESLNRQKTGCSLHLKSPSSIQVPPHP